MVDILLIAIILMYTSVRIKDSYAVFITSIINVIYTCYIARSFIGESNMIIKVAIISVVLLLIMFALMGLDEMFSAKLEYEYIIEWRNNNLYRDVEKVLITILSSIGIAGIGLSIKNMVGIQCYSVTVTVISLGILSARYCGLRFKYIVCMIIDIVFIVINISSERWVLIVYICVLIYTVIQYMVCDKLNRIMVGDKI